MNYLSYSYRHKLITKSNPGTS